MPFLRDNILSSLFAIVTSSSSLATTEDLASLLLRLAVVILVAIGGGGGRGGGGVEASNYTDRRPPMWRSGTDHALNAAPRASQLNRSALRTRLGADFDADWMSIDEPFPLTGFLRRDSVDPDLAEDLRDLDFTYADERGDRRTIPAAVRGIFERWLIERGTCRVRFEWRDLGPTFWPRWVRHGSCDTEAACSWPPGMHCAPTESDTIRLLQCRRRQGSRRRRSGTEEDSEEEEDSEASAGEGGTGGGRHRRNQRQPRCQWRKVPYPVTSDCFCSC